MSIYKGSQKIKDIYLGTQNTNCLTHIPNDINLTLDPLNVTVTGSITNSNGILSAFNTGVYASTEIKETGNEDIIFKAKVTTHKTYNTIFSSVTKKCAVAFNSAGKLCLKLVDWQGGKTAYSTGTWVWCRFVWDGSKVYIYTLADNSYTLNTLPELSSWTLEYSVSKSNGYFGGDTLNVGWSNISTNYYFNGSIDITQSQIKMGGSVIWKGGTGNLTLKKGSKVYLAHGTLGDTYTTTADISETSTSNGTYFVILDDPSSFYLANAINCLSGTIANRPTSLSTSTGLYFATNEHKIYLTGDSGSNWYNGAHYSLPFAIITVSDGYISSIDQVFNGFGYIGSTVYALPGVKGLIANGLNTDGTYKNKTEWVNDRVRIADNLYSDANAFSIRNNNLVTNRYFGEYATAPSVGGSHGMYYNTKENQVYVSGGTTWSKESCIVLGSLTQADGKITSITPKTVQPEKITREISRIYKGSTLVYGYAPNKVLFESSTAGTATVNIEHSGYYQLWLVGAGGGGSYNSSGNKGSSAAGNSGGYVNVKAYLKKGSYSVTVGAGGAAWGGLDWSGWGNNGGNTSITFEGKTLLLAGGGTANKVSYPSGYEQNSTISVANQINSGNFTLVQTVANQVGNAGGLGGNGSSPTGGASRYDGYGKGGNVYNRNSADAGGTGYVKVVAI